jgi:hypothetical protein
LLPALEAVLLGKAVGLLGSPAKLAARLKVEEYVVLIWLTGHASIPRRILRAVVDMVLQLERSRRRTRRTARSGTRLRRRRLTLSA